MMHLDALGLRTILLFLTMNRVHLSSQTYRSRASRASQGIPMTMERHGALQDLGCFHLGVAQPAAEKTAPLQVRYEKPRD